MRMFSIRILAAILLVVLAATWMSACSRSGGDADQITVGSADFAESQLIATIYAQALEQAGLKVNRRLNIGSREVYIQALQDGSIDLVPEYNGALLAYLDPGAGAVEEVDAALAAALPDGIVALQASSAENRDELVVHQELAREHGLETVSDLAPIASGLVLAGSSEWRSRFVGADGKMRRYGIEFGQIRVFDAGGPLTLAALTGGQAQVGDMFSSDPAIAANDLVILEDDRGLFGEGRLLPLLRSDAATDAVREQLNRVSAALEQDALVAMNARMGDGDDVDAIAADWLQSHSLD